MESMLRAPHRREFARRWLAVATAAGAVMLLQMLPVQGQRLPPEDCLKPGEPLIAMPELLRSQDGKLRGTIVLGDELRRLTDTTSGECALQFLRFFYGEEAVPAGGGTPAPTATEFTDPMPGPTLRARIGDIVQLTFLNHVDPLNHAGSLDRGDDAGACDQFSSGYPENVKDTFPNCFHGSSTANIHFHGTHTNPNSTGDNVFLHVRPSPRPPGGQPLVTANSVKAPFEAFFAECEKQLRDDILSGWPRTWSDLPVAAAAWTQEQKKLLQAYDRGEPPYFPPEKPLPQQLWPENQKQLDDGQWPQYYVGAFPFCFQLPEYTATTWPPASGLTMGQAPGTHWYHAHKHGSTTLNVANGMTGAFIIEGKYDDELNDFYGEVDEHPWTRVQPVLVINQLGGAPNLARLAFGQQDFSVNGRLQPKLTMRPGEVQLWRIVNTASRGFVNLLPPTDGFEWKQLAQDGVQLADVHYQKSKNASFLMAPGNRIDLLVKAPLNLAEDKYDVMVQQTVSRAPSSEPFTVLMSVEISGTPPENMRQREFLREAPLQPVFLADITDEEVEDSPRRTLRFDSKPRGEPMQHTINGEQFSDKIGVSVVLGTAEEWKIENTTNSTTVAAIDHPFHIHINPFQVVEVFDPNEKVKGGDGNFVDKYLLGVRKEDLPDPSIQCALNADDPDTWRDCHNAKKPHGIWWDVFPVPSGRADAVRSDGSTVTIPGYFRMRSRFVDYPGLYVLHCHILAHEDRGMMTIVEVRPQGSPAGHDSPVRHH